MLIKDLFSTPVEAVKCSDMNDDYDTYMIIDSNGNRVAERLGVNQAFKIESLINNAVKDEF